jgi:hypothetical protein
VDAVVIIPTDFKPTRRSIMVREAVKLEGDCPCCRILRPLNPDTGNCWACDNLWTTDHPRAGSARQFCRKGEACADCTYKPEPEPSTARAKLDELFGDPVQETESKRLVATKNEQGQTIFWCHKPLLETHQQWGWDWEARVLVPFMDDHWYPCASWAAIFNQAQRIRNPAKRGQFLKTKTIVNPNGAWPFPAPKGRK